MSHSTATLGYNRPVFSEEHELYRSHLRKFFETEIAPHIVEWETMGFFPRELFRTAGQRGLIGGFIPEAYGGAGGDSLLHVVLMEEHGYSPAGASMEAGLSSEVTAFSILESGTEEQKRHWLPAICSGEVVCDLGLTESHSGSDPKSVRTRAQRAGDDFLISGEKSWISNGPILDMIIVVARCDGADGDASFNAFIVDTRSPGVSVSEPTPLMMRSAGGVAQFFFDEVRVPASSILGGEEGRGLSFMMGNINLARLATAARMVAACELAFELTLDFVKSRQAFGRRVLDFQNTQFKLAQLKTEIAVGRAYVDSLLHAMSSGAVTQTETSMAKLWVSEMEGRVMDECVQLHGGAGVSHEYPIAAMYAFARIHRIYLGTSEIQKVAIARSFVRD